ncbi:hypothetical protein BKA70DRAFT_1330231 [Coprinopsis sp. MPI-PUGE-AT-0042]|nr:hypothetical protein BKA70DRAFT_1330231 [Coprinopsis sp. MPI-PUGE-AT-0042]
MANLLDEVRADRIPLDFLDLFDDAGVPFYDGEWILQSFGPWLTLNQDACSSNYWASGKAKQRFYS